MADGSDDQGCVALWQLSAVSLSRERPLERPPLALGHATEIRKPHKDPWPTDALSQRRQDVRLVRRESRNRPCWVAQLILERVTSKKAKRVKRAGVVGVDLGPKTIAAVGDAALGVKGAFKRFSSPGTTAPRQKKRRLAWAFGRSRRATIPSRFDEQGRVRSGKHQWHGSERYLAVGLQMREAGRKLVATRKGKHGAVCQQLLAMSTTIPLEKLQYTAWQRCFGRSVGNRAPGQFVRDVSRKAANAGGQVVRCSPYKTRLSQYDHKGQTCTKSLSNNGTIPLPTITSSTATCTRRGCVVLSKKTFLAQLALIRAGRLSKHCWKAWRCQEQQHNR